MTTSTPDTAGTAEVAAVAEMAEVAEAAGTAGTADAADATGSTAGAAGTADATGATAGAASTPGAAGAGDPGADPDPGTGTGTDPAAGTGARGDDAASRVWRALRLVVLERHEGRKEVVEALGMSFFRIKALRRIAARPSRLSELATELGSDRPYLTLVVDDLVKRGLVERDRDPADRRSKIVTATPEGRAVAARANAILGTPPPALRALPARDLAELERIVSALAAAGG